MKGKNQLWSRVWSWFSLVLLLLFLGFWLRQTYSDEREQLQLELSGLMDRLEDAQVGAFIKVLSTSVRVDTVEDASYRFSPSTFPEKGLKRLRIQADHPSSFSFATDTIEGISAWEDMMVVVEPKHQADSNFVFPDLRLRNDSFPLRFQHLIDTTIWRTKKNRPMLVDLRKDSLQDAKSVLLSKTGGSQSFFGGPRFAVGLRQYPKLLLSRMLPELGFALVLFSSVLFSFYLIRRNQKKQAQLLTLKNDFMANISHELNTPITTVSVALEALEINPAKKEDYLDIARKELGRLSLLVDRVLHLSQHEEGQLRLRKEEVDLEELCQELLHVLSLRFQKENANFTFQTKGKQFQMTTDPLHLSNVLHNLIDNALKYSDAPAQIDIRLLELARHFEIHISDQGIGIPKNAQARLFEKFYRVPDPRGHVVKGHGLGLSYVAQVIQAMGGQIKVKSEVGQSSTFSIHLPKSTS